MIVVADVDPNAVQTYHEIGKSKEAASKIARIKDTAEYSALKSSIMADSIKDPIIISFKSYT